MTTARDIVTQALREGGILALGETPEADSFAEGLTRLNTLIKGTFGYDLGENLTVLNIGYQDLETPEALDVAVNSASGTDYVPNNTLLHASLEEPSKVYLDPAPVDGSRIGVLDLRGNFATNSLEIHANGKKIDGADSVVLSTNGFSMEWFYRADLGEWVRSLPLAASDEMPFPLEFDDYFITALAFRLSRRYGQAVAPETLEVYRKSRSQLRARYAQKKERASEAGLRQITPDWFWTTAADFRRGRPWNY